MRSRISAGALSGMRSGGVSCELRAGLIQPNQPLPLLRHHHRHSGLICGVPGVIASYG